MDKYNNFPLRKVSSITNRLNSIEQTIGELNGSIANIDDRFSNMFNAANSNSSNSSNNRNNNGNNNHNNNNRKGNNQ